MAKAETGRAQLDSDVCGQCGTVTLWKAGGPRPETDHLCIPWLDQLASTRERRRQQRQWLYKQRQAGKILPAF